MAAAPSLSLQDQFMQANANPGESLQDAMRLKIAAGLTLPSTATCRRTSADGQMNLYSRVKWFQ